MPEHQSEPADAHYVIDITKRGLDWKDRSEVAARQMVRSSAIRAFRSTKIVEGLPTPTLNTSGNLRGMVLSRNARTAFNISSKGVKVVEAAGKIALVVGIAVELYELKDDIKAIYHSNISSKAKAAHLTSIAASAAMRAVSAPIPMFGHLVAKSVEGYLGLAELVDKSHTERYEYWKKNFQDSAVTLDNVQHQLTDAKTLMKVGANVSLEVHNVINMTVNVH